MTTRPEPLKVTPLTGWQKDSGAYDPYARQREFTVEGVAGVLVACSLRGPGADDWPMSIRYRADGGYVTTVGNWRRIGVELQFLVDAPGARHPEMLGVPPHH